MSRSSAEGLDLSNPEQWRGLRPGMTRAEVMAAIAQAGVGFSEDEEELSIAEWEIDLIFAEEGEERLRQISVDDDAARWAGKAVIAQPLHVALLALGPGLARGAGWRQEDAMAYAFDELKPEPPRPASDAQLLSEGTLWFPQRQLGIVMCAGEVNELVWRQPHEIPTQFLGGITESQLRLSQQPDLRGHLREKVTEEWSATAASPPANPLQRVLTALFIGALIFLGVNGFKEQQSWLHAAILQGKVTAIEPSPTNPNEQIFQVAYEPPSGGARTTPLERRDFYVTPREIGAEAPLRWVEGDPPRVAGMARAQDQAFLIYLPRFLGVGIVYLAASLGAGFYWRRKKAAVANAASV